jgi:5-methyltetrahydrofolate--homocysteine methyltransferase
VKIAPHYAGPVVYVKDASRAVGLKTDYAEVRERHLAQRGESKRSQRWLSARQQIQDRLVAYAPPAPKPGRAGIRELRPGRTRRLIDWTPFFQSWELHGRYPRILEDEVVGEEARKLFADAQAMLKRMIDENWVEARAVIGLFPANSVGR